MITSITVLYDFVWVNKKFVLLGYGNKIIIYYSIRVGKTMDYNKGRFRPHASQLDIHVDFEEVSTNEIFNVVLNCGRNNSKYR